MSTNPPIAPTAFGYVRADDMVDEIEGPPHNLRALLGLRGALQHPEQGVTALGATSLGLALDPAQTTLDQLDVGRAGDMVLANGILAWRSDRATSKRAAAAD